jgi:hypothetical protein
MNVLCRAVDVVLNDTVLLMSLLTDCECMNGEKWQHIFLIEGKERKWGKRSDDILTEDRRECRDYQKTKALFSLHLAFLNINN